MPRHRVITLASLILLANWAMACAYVGNCVDEDGTLRHLAIGTGWTEAGSAVQVPLKGWKSVPSICQADNRKSTDDGPTHLVRATVNGVEIEQRTREDVGKIVFDIKATRVADVNIEGVFFALSLPARTFATGTLLISGKTINLPATLPPEIHLFDGPAATFTVLAPDRPLLSTEIHVQASAACEVLFQDARRWNDEFTAMLWLHRGNLAPGQTAQLRLTVWASGQIDATPAHVVIDPNGACYQFGGTGGNYCFNIESPVAAFTMDNLAIAAARTEMSLRAWAPQAGLATTDDDWKSLAGADKPDSRLRHELELLGKLQRKRIPIISSVWRIPPWMGDLISKDQEHEIRHIAGPQWDGVLRAIGTYLLYARDQYGAEPDYFSFNETNYGVDIRQTPEEHRDDIKRLGAHFEKLGLKTRCLLGDVAGPRGTDKFVLAAAADPMAMKYVGAISFHSWGGASPGQYTAWADLATKLDRPLIVAEAGPDANAWHGAAYRSFANAIREMIHYQELLLYARPRHILYWEFTGDYSLMADPANGQTQAAMTERFCLQKHFCDLTPRPAQALPTKCGCQEILATAFVGNDGAYSLHLANAGWERTVTIAGLPLDQKALGVVRTARGEYFKIMEPITSRDGTATLVLPAESFTTMTTLPTPAPVAFKTEK